MARRRAQLNTVRETSETAAFISSAGREMPDTQLEKIISRIAPPVNNNGSNTVTGDTHVKRVSANNDSILTSPEMALSEKKRKFDNQFKQAEQKVRLQRKKLRLKRLQMETNN
jgi:hydrogenase maturation factor